MVPFSKCCEHYCVKQFCNPDELKSLRETIAPMNEHERTQWIAEKIVEANSRLQPLHLTSKFSSGSSSSSSSSSTSGSSNDTISAQPCEEARNKHVNYVLNGKHCCRTAFRKVLGISNFKLNHVRDVAKNITDNGPNKQFHRNCDKMVKLMAWWELLIKEQGQFMTNGEVHLNYYHTWSDLYNRYASDLKQQKDAQFIVTKAHFFKVKIAHFSHLKLAKVIRMSKCTSCVRFAAQNAKRRRMKKAERAALDAQIRRHNNMHINERKKYMKRCMKASNEPKSYMSIIVDGSSHKDFPHKVTKPKALDAVKLLRVGCFALINHCEKNSELHWQLPVWPGDSNVIISIIWQHICNESKTRPLPKTLYLQLDNCYRENKNKYMLGFLEWLVDKKIFTKVVLSFMIVGHTHCDVDQLHSIWIKWYNKHDCDTPVQLIDQCPTIFGKHTPTKSQLLSNVFDWKSWMKPHFNNAYNQSSPQTFKVQRNDDGVPVVYHKSYSTCKRWQGGTTPVLQVSLQRNPQPLAPKKLDTEALQELGKASNFLDDNEAKQWYQELINGAIPGTPQEAQWQWPTVHDAMDLDTTDTTDTTAPTVELPPQRKKKPFIVEAVSKLHKIVDYSTDIRKDHVVVVNRQEPNCNAGFRLAFVTRVIAGEPDKVHVEFYELTDADEDKNYYEYAVAHGSKREEAVLKRSDMLLIGEYLLTDNNTLHKSTAKEAKKLRKQMDARGQ